MGSFDAVAKKLGSSCRLAFNSPPLLSAAQARDEILKSGSLPPNDCCGAIKVISKAAGGACSTPQPFLSSLNWFALAAQAIQQAVGCAPKS